MTKDFILPPKLEKGDKVAVLATSSGIAERFPAAFERGIDRLENRFNLEPVIFDTARKSTEYLHNNPEEKAEDLMEAFRNPEIKGVIPVSGGEQELRVLKHLDPDVLKDNPTRFYGISDNTNIHTYLWNLGIQSFYAGQLVPDLMLGEDLSDYSFKHLEKAFFSDNLGVVESSSKFADQHLDFEAEEITDGRERFDNQGWEFWNFDGEVEGRLWGGCFEVVYWLLAANKNIPNPEELEDSILALETACDCPSSEEVRRMLICMGERGFLQKFKAVIVGRPCRQPFGEDERSREERVEYQEDQKQTLKEEIKRYCPDTPVVFDVDFGHTDPKLPLQLGGKIEIKPDQETIEFR